MHIGVFIFHSTFLFSNLSNLSERNIFAKASHFNNFFSTFRVCWEKTNKTEKDRTVPYVTLIVNIQITGRLFMVLVMIQWLNDYKHVPVITRFLNDFSLLLH